MKIAIIIYLSGGILLNFYGEFAEMIRSDLRNYKHQSSVNPGNGNPGNFGFKLIAVEIVLRLLIIVLFPVVLVVMIIDKIRGGERTRPYAPWDKKEIKEIVRKELEERKKAVIENRGYVYFKGISGGGIIKCNGCGYTEEIVAFTHGFGDPCPYTKGYQCQSCGKFDTIRFLGNERTSPDKCSCGEKLSNEKPLFCPQCKARDITYSWTYIT